MQVIYYKQSNLKVSWDERSQSVLYQVRGSLSKPTAQLSLNQVLALVQDKQATRLLLDLEDSTFPDQELENWFYQELTGRLLAAGLKRLCVVVPGGELLRALRVKVLQKFPNEGGPGTGTATVFFTSTKAARRWLSFS